MTDRQNPTPAAVYARVSSDRQDVDLSVAAQLRAAGRSPRPSRTEVGTPTTYATRC